MGLRSFQFFKPFGNKKATQTTPLSLSLTTTLTLVYYNSWHLSMGNFFTNAQVVVFEDATLLGTLKVRLKRPARSQMPCRSL